VVSVVAGCRPDRDELVGVRGWHNGRGGRRRYGRGDGTCVAEATDMPLSDREEDEAASDVPVGGGERPQASSQRQ